METRYSPSGKKKKRPMRWQQKAALVLSGALVVAFCAFGLPYMIVGDVVQASPPTGTPAAPSATLPAVQTSASPAPSDAPAETATATPEPTPFVPILTEDAENGVWAYEDAAVRIDIERQQPLDGVVATAAVITPKQGALPLRTAFAEGTFGQNVRARTREIADSVGAVFAINGDYCGFRDDGIIVRDGVSYRDNPARDALCLFQDGTMQILDEDEMDVEALLTQGLWDSWSFGPALVVDGALPERYDTDVSGKNPRTAIGQRADGSYVAVAVDGRLPGYSEGMTIEELAQYMLSLGCVTAYNLDGGMTSCMYFNGSVISTPCGTANQERSVSDILFVAPAE